MVMMVILIYTNMAIFVDRHNRCFFPQVSTAKNILFVIKINVLLLSKEFCHIYKIVATLMATGKVGWMSHAIDIIQPTTMNSEHNIMLVVDL